MRRVFFDTWAWVSIAHADDKNHPVAASFYRSFLRDGGMPVTTDYVLGEAITLLRSRTRPQSAILFFDTLLEGVRKGRIVLEHVDPQRWEKSWEMSKKYSDKPSISFVDFTSFVIMRELKVKDVATSDKHFEEVGLHFRKLF
jgi:predicted nucleic acid-binding protein